MASVFWDAEGIIIVKYLKKGATIMDSYYADQKRRLRQVIKEKKRRKLRVSVVSPKQRTGSQAAVAMATIQETGFELLENPPYPPDLAPSDLYLFFRPKKHL
ncbi:hypothetical protein PYW07_004849 [Mythimna separata]|uniref:Transposase n=1 Tax=Mythimna separata TaxID=271217 RepID=A0AAD7YZE1_MYTSE|nr:hypothetical protein PYW07_004849 [Mythimna separata]